MFKEGMDQISWTKNWIQFLGKVLCYCCLRILFYTDRILFRSWDNSLRVKDDSASICFKNLGNQASHDRKALTRHWGLDDRPIIFAKIRKWGLWNWIIQQSDWKKSDDTLLNNWGLQLVTKDLASWFQKERRI